MLWQSPRDLKYPMVLSCGDADRDGDLDIFIGQYKGPYENGTLPTPFYDANDGHPFYLLRNEGSFRFADVTADSGLAARRRRRIYSAPLSTRTEGTAPIWPLSATLPAPNFT